MALFKEKIVELSSSDTVIAPDAFLKGDIIVKGSIKIEGNVEGSVNESRTVTIGKNGRIKGDISCDRCVVYGEIKGNIFASEHVEAMSNCRIEGDIKAVRVTMEEGAFFNGKCLMEAGPEKAAKETKKGE
ncbi:MAG: hypothetical protein COT17_01980 [Elusimicrobia bacterium CG08_land_8_20_14_0_20_51_18]|nr:MAG: hypothetical protein COT17_01980 [Elusimicrobia bacterium CG08_land_8_20_14_0_20_51_18]